MTTYSRSFFQNTNNWQFWIRKNKLIIKCNITRTRYGLDLFVCQRSIRIERLAINREDSGIKHYNDPKAFMEYSSTMDDVYNNINDYNPNRN